MGVDRRFEAIVFDWDGTAVPDREADASEIRRLIEAGCTAGLHFVVVTGTHVGNVDGQLLARPDGPGKLLLALNRGSEVFDVGRDGPQLIARRDATPDEDDALDRAADLTVARLGQHGVTAKIVSQPLNRRKVDVIPLPEWADPPNAEIDRLLAAVEQRLRDAGIGGLPEVVALATDAAREAGLSDPKVSSDVKHVEIGLTDTTDSSKWVFDWLWAHGIGPGLVLVAGDEVGPLGGLPGRDSRLLVGAAERATAISVGVEPTGVPEGVLHLPGGPDRFLEIIADQLERRRRGDVPDIDRTPGWTLTFDGVDPEHERARAALLTLADGQFGSNGSPTVPHPSAVPRTFTAGVYDGAGPETHLLPGPVWYRIGGDPTGGRGVRRVLDIRTGVLHESTATGDGSHDGDDPVGYRSLRFSSLRRPGTVALRIDHTGGVDHAPRLLELFDGERTVEDVVSPGRHTMRIAATEGGGLAASAHERATDAPGGGRERFGVFVADPDVLPESESSQRAVRNVAAAGFDHLLAEHREAWAARWEDADVIIDGDDQMQIAIRSALYHLFGATTDRGEAAVGARGVSGPGYRGHVFWDSDVYVLPVLAATHPPSARAMLEYRVRRLPAARAAAAEEGHRGARFPWESARTGRDVTPTSARDLTGRVIPIRTGQLEIHISACVPWAAMDYVDWTGDHAFAAGPGRALLIETARFWASRIRADGDGAHIYGVIGPDEYHEPVDDNAFTNVMARWTLRRAAAAAVAEPVSGEEIVTAAERRRWLDLAERLVDGYDPATGIYEEFAGYHSLEPLLATQVLPSRPITADLVLGAERVHRSQIIKQADVLMLHHMVPGEVVTGSLRPNLEFYEPRTSHGSSLSPAIHAALMARVGRPDEALETLRMAADIDLNDTTATTAGGVHMATLGGIWHAIAYGFCGVRPGGDVFRLDPCLPAAWRALELRLLYRDHRVRIAATHETVRVSADRVLRVGVGSAEAPAGPDGVLFRRHNDTWEVVP